MNFETASAFDNAYEVFACYRDSFGFARQSGVSHSLRNLTRDDWDEMDEKFDMGPVLFSDGSILLRHFLPRFLEWIIQDYPSALEFPWTDLQTLSYRLNHARWLEWPMQEIEALRAIFAAWTREVATESDDKIPIDFLMGIEDDLIPYLEIWLQACPYEMGKWLWESKWKNNESVWRWTISPHVEETLEAAFFRNPNGKEADLLSRSIEMVRSLRG